MIENLLTWTITGFQSFAVLCTAVCTHGWHCPSDRFSARLLFERRSRCVWLLPAGEHRPVQRFYVAKSWRLLAARLRDLSESIPCGISLSGLAGDGSVCTCVGGCRHLVSSDLHLASLRRQDSPVPLAPPCWEFSEFSLFGWRAVGYHQICGGDCHVPPVACQPGGVGASTASSLGPF